MKLSNKRMLWSYDVEKIAALVANKPEHEVYDILQDYNVIELKPTEPVKSTILSRLLLPLGWVLILAIYFVKFIITGDGTLDVWCKKYKTFGKFCNYFGFL